MTQAQSRLWHRYLRGKLPLLPQELLNQPTLPLPPWATQLLSSTREEGRELFQRLRPVYRQVRFHRLLITETHTIWRSLLIHALCDTHSTLQERKYYLSATQDIPVSIPASVLISLAPSALRWVFRFVNFRSRYNLRSDDWAAFSKEQLLAIESTPAFRTALFEHLQDIVENFDNSVPTVLFTYLHRLPRRVPQWKLTRLRDIAAQGDFHAQSEWFRTTYRLVHEVPHLFWNGAPRTKFLQWADAKTTYHERAEILLSCTVPNK